MIIREICNNNTAQQLKEIAKSNGLSGYSKLKKAELVDFVTEYLTCYDTIAETLFLATDDELKVLEQVCKEKVKIEVTEAYYYAYFFRKCYFIINESGEVSVPDDVKRMVPVICSKDFMKERAQFQQKLNYCKAMANLYGIIPLNQAVEIYNRQNATTIEVEELRDVVERALNAGINVAIKEEQLVHVLLMENENAYHTLLKKQENKTFYIPTKNEFLCYANDFYVEENKGLQALEQYMISNLFVTKEVACEVCGTIERLFSEGKDITDMVKEFDFASDAQKKDLIELIIAYTNEVRLWENCGNTKSELGIATNLSNVMNVTTTPVTVKRSERKIGRNEPCPCGSGKKYKKCCGK